MSRKLADLDGDNRLNETEFVIAMHLVNSVRTRRMPLPKTTPQDLLDSLGVKKPTAKPTITAPNSGPRGGSLTDLLPPSEDPPLSLDSFGQTPSAAAQPAAAAAAAPPPSMTQSMTMPPPQPQHQQWNMPAQPIAAPGSSGRPSGHVPMPAPIRVGRGPPGNGQLADKRREVNTFNQTRATGVNDYNKTVSELRREGERWNRKRQLLLILLFVVCPQLMAQESADRELARLRMELETARKQHFSLQQKKEFAQNQVEIVKKQVGDYKRMLKDKQDEYDVDRKAMEQLEKEVSEEKNNLQKLKATLESKTLEIDRELMFICLWVWVWVWVVWRHRS